MVREIRNGILYFDGCNTVELAKEYGTPLYVVSETEIVERINQLKIEFLYKYENSRVAYAAKAFCTTAMMRLCHREGIGVDVVSGGELHSAIKAGIPGEKIEFNGNNKLPSEIEDAIDYGIGRIIIDGLHELDLIESICKKKNTRINVLYRITPGVVSDSHDYIVTGKKDSKFGIPLDKDVIYPEIERALNSEYVNFLGFHFHVGSQLFDNNSHLQAVEIMLDYVNGVRKKLGFLCTELNLGGGFGAIYTREERKSFGYFLEPMMEKIQKFYSNLGANMPSVVIEPGRSIVAEAGITLYTVGSIKDIKGVRKYVSIDGGMTDNIRPALYQAVYEGVVANKANEPKNEVVTISGKCCESGDILIRDGKITENVETGDIFAIFSTGAYGFSMASNYNNIPIPAVVLVKDGRSELIVKRQSYDDIIKNNIIPDSLR